jgi:hypothetical protein
MKTNIRLQYYFSKFFPKRIQFQTKVVENTKYTFNAKYIPPRKWYRLPDNYLPNVTSSKNNSLTCLQFGIT